MADFSLFFQNFSNGVRNLSGRQVVQLFGFRRVLVWRFTSWGTHLDDSDDEDEDDDDDSDDDSEDDEEEEDDADDDEDFK